MLDPTTIKIGDCIKVSFKDGSSIIYLVEGKPFINKKIFRSENVRCLVPVLFGQKSITLKIDYDIQSLEIKELSWHGFEATSLGFGNFTLSFGDFTDSLKSIDTIA